MSEQLTAWYAHLRERYQNGEAPIKELPAVGAERALRIIAGRWKLVLLWSLLERPKRLRDLERLLPEARQKVLLDQLRELEAHGLVVRSVEPGPPVLVTYEATPLGRSLRPLVLDLCAWDDAMLGRPTVASDGIVRRLHHGTSGITGSRRFVETCCAPVVHDRPRWLGRRQLPQAPSAA